MPSRKAQVMELIPKLENLLNFLHCSNGGDSSVSIEYTDSENESLIVNINGAKYGICIECDSLSAIVYEVVSKVIYKV